MKKLLLTILVAATVISVGCADKKSTNPGTTPAVGGWDPNQPYIPPSSGPGFGPGSDWQHGGTAELSVTASKMAQYLGWTPNVLSNVRLNLNFLKFGNGYGGTVTIGFENNGKKYEDYFTSRVNSYGMVKTDEENHKYNIWFQKDGKLVYHGFFQDNYGGLVVVIDGVESLGDGQGFSDNASGSIWFKLWDPIGTGPLSPTSCWFVSLGPYDCRAWKDGHGVDTNRAIHPDNGYVKLGEFTGMNLDKAFNNELNF